MVSGQVLLDQLRLVGLPVRVQEVHRPALFENLHDPALPGVQRPKHRHVILRQMPTDRPPRASTTTPTSPSSAQARPAPLRPSPFSRRAPVPGSCLSTAQSSPGTSRAGTASRRRSSTCWPASECAACSTTGRRSTGSSSDIPAVRGWRGGPPARTGWCPAGSSTPGSSTRPSRAARRCYAGACGRSRCPRAGTPSVPGGPVVAGVRAQVVVGADGAHSAVRAALGPAGGGATAIALRGYAPVTPRLAHAQVIAFDPLGSWPAYAWSFPVGDGSANVGYGEILDADGRAPTAPACSPGSTPCCRAPRRAPPTGRATTCRCRRGVGISRTAGCSSRGTRSAWSTP